MWPYIPFKGKALPKPRSARQVHQAETTLATLGREHVSLLNGTIVSALSSGSFFLVGRGGEVGPTKMGALIMCRFQKSRALVLL